MQLLSLTDQIYLWAITEFRTFVLDHLRPWHQLCEENYLLEWDSKYDVPKQKKRKRAPTDTNNLMVPNWVADMEESNRRSFQARAKISLKEAIEHSSLLKGKLRCDEETGCSWTCIVADCGHTDDLEATYLDHLWKVHDYTDRELAQVRWCIQEQRTHAEIKARQKCGVMATGSRFPIHLGPHPFQEPEVAGGDIFSSHPAQHRKIFAAEK